jgi:phosphodiesterase/alkaline phosphatase D-like protein
MSQYAKILSLFYDSAEVIKGTALKTSWRSVRLIKEDNFINPGQDSRYTNILLNGDCIDAENRTLYLFYIDIYFGSAWIIEFNLDTREQKVVYYDQYNSIGFDPLYKIHNARVVHGKLIWTNNKNPIYQMDIERAKESYYHQIGYGSYPVTTEWNSIVHYHAGENVSSANYIYKALIDNNNEDPQLDTTQTIWKLLCLIEDAYYSMDIRNFYFEAMPPKLPPVVVYQKDSTKTINNLRQTLFQFAYRYIYMDWRKSTFSPASIVPIPLAEENPATGLANEDLSLNNKLQITVNRGGEEVRGLEIVGRSSQDPSKWYLIETINKFEEQERGNQISKRTESGYLPLSITMMAPTVINLSAPDAPVAIAASRNTSNSFYANWNIVSGINGYMIDVATDVDFINYVSGYHNKDVYTFNSYPIYGLTSYVPYYYRIRSYDGNLLNSKYSNTITVTLFLDQPFALPPTDITGSGFNANWGAVVGATGYRLDVAEDEAFTSFVAGYNNKDVGNVLSETIAGLNINTTYFYRVRAYNGFGTSVSSNYVSQKTEVPPDDVIATAATGITTNSFYATWNAATGVTGTNSGYHLDVATDNAFVNIVSGYNNRFVGNILTFLVEGISENTNYYYRLRGINSKGIKSVNYSNVITVLTSLGPPVALDPTNVFETGMTANWEAKTGAIGYLIDVATDYLFANMVMGFDGLDVGNVLNYDITGLTINTAYFYRLKAYTGVQSSGYSNIIDKRTQTPPDSPLALAATDINIINFTANWEAVLFITGYRLDVATDPNFINMVSGFDNRDVYKVLRFVVTGLTQNTTYYYRVKSYNGHAIESIYSNTIDVTTLVASPVALEATEITAIGMTANWEAVERAIGYRLDVASDIDFTSLLAGYNDLDVDNVFKYDITGLSVDTVYYYRVRAYTSSQISASSNVIDQRTQAPPDGPIAKAATDINATSFYANWSKTDESVDFGYLLDVATDVAFANKVNGYDNRDVSNVTTFLVRGLTAETNYFYRIMAYNSHGVLSDWSNTITVATAVISVPSPPVTKVASDITENSFMANWEASAGATGYKIDVSPTIDFDSFVTINGVEEYNNYNVGNVLTFKISGLSPNAYYFYRVRAYNNNGTSSTGAEIQVLTSPPSDTFIVLNPAAINFGGSGADYRESVLIQTNGSSWDIVWPSTNDYIHLYENLTDNEIEVYYTGPFGSSDEVTFTADGPGGLRTVIFTGSWT